LKFNFLHYPIHFFFNFRSGMFSGFRPSLAHGPDKLRTDNFIQKKISV